MFWTTCEEKSASVVLSARWSMIIGLRASGAMVVTYWSVLVTVRMAQADTTETGMSSDASTMSTQEMIPLVRRARGFFSAISGASAAATSVDGVSSGLMSRHLLQVLPAVVSDQRVLAHTA